MDNMKMAELLFPHIEKTPEEYEKMYPERNLPEGAKVTRLGPSPTGFIHLGNLYGAFVDERLAHQSGGVFYLRIEDTDDKRYVEGAVKTIIESLGFFGINFDEGATLNGDVGDYGDYTQSHREEIYKCFAKKLVAEGKAYPCFLTEDEIAGFGETLSYEEVDTDGNPTGEMTAVCGVKLDSDQLDSIFGDDGAGIFVVANADLEQSKQLFLDLIAAG